jgi:cyclophilin family peptidyl-prolyl cis-trans isomerase
MISPLQEKHAMSKNSQIRETVKHRRQIRQRNTRIIAIVIILLIIALLAWMIISSRQAEKTAAAPTASGTCQVSQMQFATPPPMQIDTTKQYFATVKMARGGEFVIQLYPDKAPITVNSFVFLARQGFYNCVTFHRVLSEFMAQAGDQTGTGGSGPGYTFVNEKNDLVFDKAGVVAMANAGPDTNGSQFFITFNPVGLSESDYTIFGQVISGMDVVSAITLRDPNQNPDFTGDVMESVTITEK